MTNGTCAACGVGSADRHHIKTRGSGGSDEPYNILWLCRPCHTKIHYEGNRKFLTKYPHVEEYLLSIGWTWLNGKLFYEGIDK